MDPKALDLETLKTQDSLSEEQIEAIGLSVLEEEKKEKEEPKEKPEEKIEKEKVDKSKEKEGTPESKEKETSELSEEEKAKAEKEKVEVEEKRLLEAKDEELGEEDKVKKAELVKKQEEIKQKAFDDEVASYAKESEMPFEEARKDLESISKLQEKYKNDPKQLAKANLYLQRLYTKTQEDLKALKDAKPSIQAQQITYDVVIKYIDDGNLKVNGKPATRDEVIEAYRQKESQLTENLDDESVLKLAAKAIKDGIEAQQKENTVKLSVDAKEKKSKLISDLSEEDKQYLPEIKPILDLQSDAQIMNPNFSTKDFILWAKGKTKEQAVKEAEERGYKRGLEQAKILGVKQTPEGGKPPKTKSSVTLTAAQKERALNMYDGLEMTEEQKYEAYIDYLKDEKKK